MQTLKIWGFQRILCLKYGEVIGLARVAKILIEQRNRMLSMWNIIEEFECLQSWILLNSAP